MLHTMWINLENMLSEARQKRLYIVRFHSHEMFRIGKSIDIESRLVVARGQRREGLGTGFTCGLTKIF